jgi:RNA polymerase sigma-70 factor (ECF subfamily)
MHESSHNEKELLLQLSKGNESAFQEIYNRYHNKIAAFAFLLTESSYLTEEITQEVFIRLWLHRRTLNSIANFNAWLHMVTKNLVTDAIKKVAKDMLVKGALNNAYATDNNADGILLFKEKEQLLKEALKLLSPRQQIVYRLSREQGMKNEDISRELHLADKTVRNHLTNAMRIIREYFFLNMGT